jgi:3-oxoadipate enol-lactonase/4-carboxymuconolactone decarboxylase
MPFTTNEGARIHWREQGPHGAPWIVLLHSIGTDMSLYDDVVPLLERHFRLLRVDIRGHGESGAPEGDYSLDLLVRDMVTAMDGAGAERAVICGISLGGMIAMQFALSHPERVAGLVLACTSAAMSPALWPERIATVRSAGVAAIADGWVERHFSPGFAKANAELAETVLAGFKQMHSAGYIGAAAAIRDMAVLDRHGSVTAPTLVIAGKQDIATPFAGHGDRIAAAIPHATVVTLPTAHLACAEQPELFSRCVAELARHCA